MNQDLTVLIHSVLTRRSSELVVEFVDGPHIACKPAEPGRAPWGHLWRWEVRPMDDVRSLVVHTYDWTELTDPARYPRARATTSDPLALSLPRLASLLVAYPACPSLSPLFPLHPFLLFTCLLHSLSPPAFLPLSSFLSFPFPLYPFPSPLLLFPFFSFLLFFSF